MIILSFVKFHTLLVYIVIDCDGLCLWHAIAYPKFSQQAPTDGSG